MRKEGEMVSAKKIKRDWYIGAQEVLPESCCSQSKRLRGAVVIVDALMLRYRSIRDAAWVMLLLK
jgi:hypothetical protein